MPRLVFESEEPITFHDDEGNVIAETTGGFMLPLLATAAGPLISKLIESLTGKTPKSMCTCDGSGFKLRKTKGKGMEQELASYLVPSTPRGSGVRGRGKTGKVRRGGDISMGAEEFAIPSGDSEVGLQEIMQSMGSMGGPAKVQRSPFSYNEITYPKTAEGGGRKKKRGRGVRGGFAVDQQQSNNYTGFNMGSRTMFPINRG